MLMKAGYDDVQIGSANIKFNMDKVTELVKTYTAMKDRIRDFIQALTITNLQETPEVAVCRERIPMETRPTR